MSGITHRLLDCNKFQPEITPPRQPMLERGESVRAISVLAVVAAVVHAQDVAGSGGLDRDLAPRAFRDGARPIDQPFGCWSAPVTRERAPHHGTKTEFAGGVGKPRTAQSPGRAKELRRRCCRVADRVLTSAQFITSSRRTGAEQIRMRLGVVANHVAASDVLAN